MDDRAKVWVVAAVAAVVAGCGQAANDLFCASGGGCFFTDDEWSQIEKLSPLPDPPPDPSNSLIGNEAAIQLGWKLYFDCGLSGNATWVDMLGRTTSSARAAPGKPTGLSCASCHNPAHAGTDTSSSPGNVSVGAGWYDVNGQQTVNAAYYKLIYWNGRADSLWAQAAGVIESPVSMNSSRLAVMWRIYDQYKPDYDSLFPSMPLPVGPGDVRTCAATSPPCDPCVAVQNDAGQTSCQPPFPAAGRPGAIAGCQAHSPDTPGEPYGDAFDCMSADDQKAVTAVYVNVVKAVAAYEFELRSRRSPFDDFVAGKKGAPPPPDAGSDAGAPSVADAGNPDARDAGPTAYPDAALRGLKLFVSRASCIDCHNTPLFSDNLFHDIGVPQQGQGVPTVSDCPAGSAVCDCSDPGKNCLPSGYYLGLEKLVSSPFRRDGTHSDDAAKGGPAYKAIYTLAPNRGPAQWGTWRTPSLRDVALTAPYMHDGVYATLDDVVWHYNEGGTAPVRGDKAPQLHPLLLSDGDRADLVAFLQTLTGKPDRPALHLPPPEPADYQRTCLGWTP
jgi:cytochrome c peroxidase